MIKRLLAIAFIYVGASLAWLVLGGTIATRTHSADNRLHDRVQSVWGVAQTQAAPTAFYDTQFKTQETVTENGKQKVVERSQTIAHAVAPSASDVAVNLVLEHRQKGLMWYATYAVDFRGDYEFRNPDSAAQPMRYVLSLPSATALYDGLTFVVNGQSVTPTIADNTAFSIGQLGPGETAKVRVAYRSQGLETWAYSFGDKVKPVRNFHLAMLTNFADIDFPENTLAATTRQRSVGGWKLDWNYQNLLSGYQIAMAMPQKLQPGPLASEISFFAPVSLFFFFFVMFILTTTRNLELHPMNYFFLAAAFFAFHLLLAYLVDHMEIHWAFVLSSVISVALVVSYLRIVVGHSFALREAALAQFTFLVLFSFAFFFKGFTGLAITIGAVLTLFIAMQMTASVRWQEKFAVRPPALPGHA